MPMISPTAISPHNRRGISWQAYWKTQHPEIAVFDAGLTTPLTTAQIIKLGEMLDTLKTGMGITSLSDAFDFLYLHGWVSEEVGLRNLVKDAHHATNHGATWAEGGGFTGDGAATYIDTNYNPSTQGSTYKLNDAGFGIYVTTDRNYSSIKAHGVINAPGLTYILPERSYANPRGGINTGTIGAGLSGVANGCIGLTSVYHDVDTTYVGRDKTNFAVDSIATSQVPNGNIFLLARNYVGTGTDYFDDVQILFSYAGKRLTQTQHNALYDALYGFFLT